MNLLIINYEMNPDSQVLSWQIKVAYALAAHFDNVTVLTHKQKNINQKPPNVKIIVFPFLAKAPFRWLGGEYVLNLWVWALHLRYHFHHCFIHMNYRWAYRLAPFFKLVGIPVSIWYAHGAVTKWLRLAHYFADKIITSNKLGFRILSKKVFYIGQGIDAELFHLQKPAKPSSNIIYAGRISAIKRIEVIVDVLSLLNTGNPTPAFTVTIIGAPLNQSDEQYYNYLQQYIETRKVTKHIFFKGALKHTEIPQYYTNSFLHLSFSDTGSLDKSLLESLSSGCPVLTSNTALFDVIEAKYQIKNLNTNIVAEQILTIYREQLTIDKNALRGLIINCHDFNSFIIRLTGSIK